MIVTFTQVPELHPGCLICTFCGAVVWIAVAHKHEEFHKTEEADRG